MVWNLPQIAREEFNRNPLSQVVFQLRFHPILKVVDRVAEFQEQVREVFPEFLQQTVQVATMTAVGAPVDVQQEQQFLFKKVDGSSTLTLTTNALSIDDRCHTGRDSLFQDIALAIKALRATHHHVSPTRLGIRYINIIDISKIASSLGEDAEWSTVITAPFLAMPNGFADLEQTTFYSEIRSPARSRGEITLRYGLLPDASGSQKFRFDIDRYHTAGFELATVSGLLEEFVKDIYGLFRAAAGEGLLRWMRQPE